MGKGGGSAEQEVNRYHMSVHFGICAEADAITGIYFGEKQAWSGEVTTATPINVSAEQLFGGDKKEGGVSGIAYYLPGPKMQVMPNGLATRRYPDFTKSPAYRGLASVYFVGNVNRLGTSGQKPDGFYWGASPYLQPVWITVRRAPKGLDPEFALIGNQVGASFNGYNVTIGGDTATLVDGITRLVAGHGVNITIDDDVRQIVFDGTVVTVDYSSGNIVSVTVNGASGIMLNGRVTLNGATVTFDGDDTVGISIGSAGGTDANPAHIIYECLTNTTWGMGAFSGLVDRANFEAVGRVLFYEGFGLSMQWSRETSIESFIGEVLDHIQAALYVDPTTGKLTIKLFRDDYDATTLPLISPDNAVLDNYQRKLWGETVNEIVVTWTNPTNEQEETITQQDLGNITVQGATVSDSRNYYAVRNSALASRLAIRDVRQSSAPLASVEALLDRTEWDLKPGSVVRLTWPEYQIENLVMRVTSIDYGKVGSPSITVSLLEDIFSLEDAEFVSAPGSGFEDPASDPTPMNHVRVITAPAYFTSRYLTAAEAATREYPAVLAMLLAGNTNNDLISYELIGLTTLPNGQSASVNRGTKRPLGWAALPVALTQQPVTVLPTFGDVSPGIGPSVGGFVFIGGGTEKTMEIALIESVDGDGYHLQRGVLDTVPRAWSAGTSLWFFDGSTDIIDDDTHSDSEDVVFKMLTRTSRGLLALSAANVVGAEMTGRPHLPNRPANVKVNGIAFGTINLAPSPPATIPITWSNRNRTLEDSTVLKWTDAAVTPEAGQTTTIRLTKTSDGSDITTINDIAGNSYDLPTSAFAGNYEADIHISAKRAGMESLQHVVRRVRIATNAAPLVDPGNGAPDSAYTPPPTTFPPLGQTA